MRLRRRYQQLSLWNKLFVWAAIASFIGLVVSVLTILLPTEINELSGEIIPGHEKDPFNNCKDIPEDAFKVFMGQTTVWFLPSLDSSVDQTVLQVGRMPVLTLRLTDKGLFVTAKVFGSDGRIIAEVVNNQFHVNSNNYFRLERGDRHELAVYDQYAHRVLYIRMLNSHSVKVLGKFYSGKHGPLIITEKGMFAGNDLGPLVLRGCKETSLTFWDSDKIHPSRNDNFDPDSKAPRISSLPDSIAEFTLNLDCVPDAIHPVNMEPFLAAQEGKDFIIDAFISLDLRYYATESDEVVPFTEDSTFRYAIEDKNGDTVYKTGEEFAQLEFAVINPRLISHEWNSPHECKLGLFKFGATMNAKKEVTTYKIPIPGICRGWIEGAGIETRTTDHLLVQVLKDGEPFPIHLSYGGSLRGTLPSAKIGDDLWFIVGRQRFSQKLDTHLHRNIFLSDIKVVASFILPYDEFIKKPYSILQSPVGIIIGINRDMNDSIYRAGHH